MDASRRSQQTKNGDGTKAKVTKSSGKQTKEKPALSPIEEETDSPDSSGDSAINFQGIEPEASAKNYPYDLRVSLRGDYEEVLQDLEDEREEEEEEEEEKQQAETPPFLTARNGSDHEAGFKSGDSNSTASFERSTPDDDDDGDEDVSSFQGESSSGDVDYPYNRDDEIDDPEDDLEEVDETVRLSESLNNMKESRPKSAPASVVIESLLEPNQEERLKEIFTIVDRLKAKLVKSEREIYCLKKQLGLEKSRSRNFVKRYEEDRNVMKESLRIDLELWIKKLNDSLKGYLAEWQQRERLRLNEEISRISDLYSQEIAKSLKISLREWQIEDAKKMFILMDKRDRSIRDKERASGNAVYEKIQSHLENLEKRNRKCYSSFRKQIDKWEDRLKEEVVKLREEDLKKLRQQIDMWREEDQKKLPAEPSPKKSKSKEHCTEKQGCSFPGSEALLHVEENLLKRLRDSNSKDLRRTEQIVRTELKAQRRELAKRMNEKIAELWMAFEEFGFAPGVGVDRARPKRLSSGLSAAAGRNDLDDCRGIAGSFMKDIMLNPDVFGGRWVGGKMIVRAPHADGSTRSSTDVEDGDRDYREDDDDDESLLEEASEKSDQHNSHIHSTLLDIGSTKNSTTPNETTGDASNAAEGSSPVIVTRK